MPLYSGKVCCFRQTVKGIVTGAVHFPVGSLASNRSGDSPDKDTDITAGVLVVALVQQIGYGVVDTSDHLPSC